MESPNLQPAGGGGAGALVRILGALTILMLAMLGILFVLDVVPLDAFRELAAKVGLIAAIVIAASFAIALVLRSPRR
ncbi:MAG TPA: hypothetical protein VFR59_00890 [Steroidobacteraceae bacterium]|nr:hypothetical protein [Steroidobacteraceae bacterium]